MAGYGVGKDKLLRLKENKSLGNVIILSRQAKHKVPLHWILSGVSFVLLRKSD